MRIAQISTHEGQGLVQIAKMIKVHDIDVAGLTEMDLGPRDSVNDLRNLLGPKYLVYAVDKGRHSCEVVLVIRKRFLWVTDDVTNTPLSDDIPGKGTGNDRWMLEVRRHRRLSTVKRSHILVHLNAAVQNPLTGTIHHGDPKTEANAKSMVKILQRVVMRDAQGYHVTVQGDFNVKRMSVSTFEEWKFLPDNFFHKYLKSVSNRLDWILINKRFKFVGHTTVIPANTLENPSDHDAVIVDIENNRG